MHALVSSLIRAQQPNGGWIYEAGTPQQSDLGQAGDSVLGTCANKAATLLRYARITGDEEVLAAGTKGLEFMEQFRVPRGGQTWECPMYEPDILAAAYAIRAYHDGYRATANPRWLRDALYWAESGVPFVYLWTLPERPMMLGATIPVFGSTFYTHTWLAVPVQWCGLVYAFHLWHLAEELEKPTTAARVAAGVLKDASPLPLQLGFGPAEWKRLVELITVSALNQQFADGPRTGTYPDSISQFEKRNPAFINPDDSMLNVFALNGHDLDIQTERLETPQGQIVVSSGARIDKLHWTNYGANEHLHFRLTTFADELSHTLVTLVKRPIRVLLDGMELPQSKETLRRNPGWSWDGDQHRLYLVLHHMHGAASVEVAF